MRKPNEAYFKALRAEVPELLKVATGRQARPPELDTFAAAFAVAGEKQEMVVDQETLALLKRFSRDPGVAKARVEFEHAQRAEETFHKDFDGLDLTMSVTRIRTIALPTSFSVCDDPKMKAAFCIIGATRGTGLLITQQLLQRGSNVTVVVRSQRVQFSSLQALKDYLQCNLSYWSNIR